MIGSCPFIGTRSSTVAISLVAMGVLVLGICCDRKNLNQKQAHSAQTYTVASYRNNASWSNNDSLWQPLLRELKISSGSWVETGSNSFAILNGDIGDVVILGERAKVCLSLQALLQHTKNPIQRGVTLLKGIAHFNIKKDSSTFLVETPSAKIMVKGTSFMVSYSEDDNSTEVQVETGQVVVVEKKTLNEIQSTTLSANEVGIGFGTSRILKRVFDTKDSALSSEFREMRHKMRNGTKTLEISRNPDSIRNHLEATMTSEISSTSIDSSSTNTHSSSNPQVTVSKVIEQEKSNYQNAKRDTLREYQNYKADKYTELDEERVKARSGLEDEKGGRGHSASDELRKRKGETRQE